MSDSVVIAGAGHAAGQVVATLKQKKFDGPVVMLGEEPYLPYQRPPLSKKFLAGEMPAERLYFKPPSFYDDDNIEIVLDTRVERIDRDGHTVRTADGREFTYGKLVLATGSRVRRLRVEGNDLEGVHYLRTIADVRAIREEFADGKRMVVVGAGYIGLEVAAVCRQLGLDVTVIEMADRVMSRVVSPVVSEFYEREHRAQGVDIRLATGLAEFAHTGGRVTGVVTNSGETVPADFVLVGVGIEPNTGLADEAGLSVDNGIVVDDHCRTADPAIFAVGDCTSHPSAIYGRDVRLESVHNALEQAKTAAANICGADEAYDQVPWFWSDQYDLKLQIAGLSQGFDDVVLRGAPDDRHFACCYLRDGVLIAVDAVNAPRDFMQSKALIANRAGVDPERLADPDTPIKDLL
ncbi:MAG: FAD-dependent oxidoreductase [Woeseiaceae bacterium]|nr:FAD-dependent oxidoreductase [Woeseiaceae bacterium]